MFAFMISPLNCFKIYLLKALLGDLFKMLHGLYSVILSNTKYSILSIPMGILTAVSI